MERRRWNIGGANDHDRGIKTGRKGNDDQCDHELYVMKIQADRRSSLRALVPPQKIRTAPGGAGEKTGCRVRLLTAGAFSKRCYPANAGQLKVKG